MTIEEIEQLIREIGEEAARKQVLGSLDELKKKALSVKFGMAMQRVKPFAPTKPNMRVQITALGRWIDAQFKINTTQRDKAQMLGLTTTLFHGIRRKQPSELTKYEYEELAIGMALHLGKSRHEMQDHIDTLEEV